VEKRNLQLVPAVEVCIPGIQVGVKVDESNWAMHLMTGAEKRERDGMIAADCQYLLVARREKVGEGFLTHSGDSFLDVEGI
tara:strand:- start:77 stop:319 length:243 start_codon:yes stop_codon:yes gene_type:complete